MASVPSATTLPGQDGEALITTMDTVTNSDQMQGDSQGKSCKVVCHALVILAQTCSERNHS